MKFMNENCIFFMKFNKNLNINIYFIKTKFFIICKYEILWKMERLNNN
jgi:hypothetical protein